jgi:hypothetical protein
VLGRLDQLGRDLAVIEWKIAAYTATVAGTEPPPSPPGWPDPSGLWPEPDQFTAHFGPDDHQTSS